MFESDAVGLFAELFSRDGYCHLNHGPDIKERVQAVDYLVIPIVKEGSIDLEDSDELTIPVCEQCLNGLLDPEWVLIICFNCIASQWIAREKAKLSYVNKKLGLSYKGIIVNGCPKCTNKLNGIWYIL